MIVKLIYFEPMELDCTRSAVSYLSAAVCASGCRPRSTTFASPELGTGKLPAPEQNGETMREGMVELHVDTIAKR